ncbi:TetR family transcriptional regulator [Alicyclobacillus cycloheptanicus]|uniref:AcrR family transcriptional regulator n=1 Tax=Alicyclobacillus cycloheptanicus TaxID=1457 RepID=A0ABT9XK44_9BACL|nr:TetR family transcriptional regulator [Alicyclobacillus cycloheptanicus]MDQ0190673.1 AcrR family transcriptional regulator [Alicyclobacillus cycloheptanicus]WDM00309.1 TetR family transcriptional regulator [Alicyclobacillus cycloheptanicus]
MDNDLRQVILDAAYELARERPADQIGYADIARKANVHWTTVRRHLGPREHLRSLLRAEQASTGMELNDTRSRILTAAERVFAEKGYSGSSLDDVAAAAGLTKGAVYWHFASKSDLFLSILERNVFEHVRLLPNEFEAIAESDNRPQAVVAWLRTELERLTADRSQAMLFFEFVSSTRDEAVEMSMREVRQRALAEALPLIESLQRRGLLTDAVDPATIGRMVLALFDGLTLAWIVDAEHMNPTASVDALARLLLQGMAGPLLNQENGGNQRDTSTES